MHVPAVNDQGQFIAPGRFGTPGDQGSLLILDSGAPLISGGGGVDHDRRVLLNWTGQLIPPVLDEEPPALPLEHTAERRQMHPPFDDYSYMDDEGVWHPSYETRWRFMPGEEYNVSSRRVLGYEGVEGFDDETHYDGSPPTNGTPKRVMQEVGARDFQWRLITGQGDSVKKFYPLPIAVNRPGTDEPMPRPCAYRTLVVTTYGMERGSKTDTYLQIHVSGASFKGERDAGFYVPTSEWAYDRNLYEQITQVTRYIWLENISGVPYIAATEANAWVNIAFLEGKWDDTTRVPQPGDENYPIGEPNWGEVRTPAEGGYLRSWQRTGWFNRNVAQYGEVLRDILPNEPLAPPQPPPLRFTAAGGRVQVEGPRRLAQGQLDDEDGQPDSTLTAFGQTFTGGTWAALRDRPIRQEDGTLDYSPVIILHAGGGEVTAVRSNGTVERCTVRQFETDILRVSPGTFRGFNSVGSYSHSWPPEWAWANCSNDTRALCAHDAWRDSYKRGAPYGSPADWSWPARPGQPPKRPLPNTPRGLLGLTLADVTAVVTQDEAIPKGEGPLQPPIAATDRDGKDVLRAVGKRLPYSPAGIPDERDDRTSVAGKVTVRFVPPEQEGIYGAALYVRYRGRANTIRVNGVDTPLMRLGHNAPLSGGWHPCVVPVDPQTTYTLEFEGRISLVGLCLRQISAGGGAS